MIRFRGRAESFRGTCANFRCFGKENSWPAWLARSPGRYCENQIDGAFINIELTSIIIVNGGEEDGRTARVNCFARTRKGAISISRSANLVSLLFGANVFFRGELRFDENTVAPGGNVFQR